MATFQTADIDRCLATGCIGPLDITRLEFAVEQSLSLTLCDAEALVRVFRACRSEVPDWPQAFARMIRDIVLDHVEPSGYVTTAKTDWLIANLAIDGHVETVPAMAALISILETARWAPPRLAVFLLDQIRQAVQTGVGPLRSAHDAARDRLTTADAALARRIVAGLCAQAGLPITRGELGMLLDIDRLAAGEPRPPAWQSLVVAAFVNAAMAASGYAQAPRREVFAARAGIAPVALGAGSEAFGLITRYCEQTAEQRAILRLEHQKIAIVTGDWFDMADAALLCDEIEARRGCGGPVDGFLALIAAEQPRLDPRISGGTKAEQKAA